MQYSNYSVQKQTDVGYNLCYTRTNLKGIQENISSSNIYVSSINQQATRLEVIVQYMFADWDSPIPQSFIVVKYPDTNLENPCVFYAFKRIKSSQSSRFEDVPVLFIYT